MKPLLPLLLALALMGQTCEPEPIPPGANPFCAENDYTIVGYMRSGVNGVRGSIDSILMGKPSISRRATVRVEFGSAYCSGVALGPRLVLSAGHCGYAATDHEIHFGAYDDQPVYRVESIRPHPEYLEYTRSGNLEARKSDLMLLYMAEDVPGPYVDGFYDHKNTVMYRQCAGAVAQGWGRWEGTGLSLRETKYVITGVNDPKYLVSRASELPPGEESGRICFGDSGGPLYVDVDGMLYLGGITTTTMSSDCMVGGTHVRVAQFKDWIIQNAVDGAGHSMLAWE